MTGEIKHYLNMVLTLPPHRAMAKGMAFLRRTLKHCRQRARDQRQPTYLPAADCPSHPLFRYLPPPAAVLVDHGNTLRAVCRHYLDHRFDLFGSGWVNVDVSRPVDADGQWLAGRLNSANLPEAQRIWRMIEPPYRPIDWQRDFKSGYRWSESTWYRDIRHGHERGVDIKVPWELARMQHLPELAAAFNGSLPHLHPLAGARARREYCREFRNQVLDFIATNPPRFGVNWNCPMDVAIRAVNWLVARDLFLAGGAAFDAPFEAIFRRSLVEHGRFIVRNLERSGNLRNNHYLADIAGLLFIAAYLPANPESDAWLEFAIAELVKETGLQFGSDGGNFEASTCYHQLSAEMVESATILVSLLHPKGRWPTPIELPDEHHQRLQRIADFSRAILKPDGTILQIGDNDSGRFIRLPSGGPLFPDEKREIPEQPLGFPQFGLWIYQNHHYHLALRCGPVGQHGIGGHAHNDQLSFQLTAGRDSVIVDPGTYVYTANPAERNRFRSTAMHNTLVLEGQEQNDWEPGQRGLFSLRRCCRARVIDAGAEEWIGEHDGFGLPCRRTVRMRTASIEVTDSCSQSGRRWVAIHLAPSVRVETLDHHVAGLRTASTRIQVVSETPASRILVEDYPYSPGYGRVVPAMCLCLHHNGPRIDWKIQIEEVK
jgi:hypothetical protein